MKLQELAAGGLISAPLIYLFTLFTQGVHGAASNSTSLAVSGPAILIPTVSEGLQTILSTALSSPALFTAGTNAPKTEAPVLSVPVAPASGGLLTDLCTEFEGILPGSNFSSPKVSRAHIPCIWDLLAPAKSPARVTPLTVSEAARICQTASFAQTVDNWVTSGSRDFLEQYTTATQGDFLRRNHGLIGSIAYRYLGEENFRCSIGMMQGCAVSCKDIVMAVEDLGEARNVYFVLSAVTHFTAVTDLIHSGLALAQNNVGLMTPKMAFAFFWSKSQSDADNARVILNLVITGVAHLFQYFTPYISFVQVINSIHIQLQNFDAEVARRAEMEHMALLFLRTANIFEAVYSQEWSDTLKKQTEPQQHFGFYPHTTGLRGDRGVAYSSHKYSVTEEHWWMYSGVERGSKKQPGENNVMDRLTRKGLKHREGGPALPPSNNRYAWGGIYQEEDNKIAAMREFKQNADSKMLAMKNDAQRIEVSVFNGWLPQVFARINNWFALEEGEGNGQDINAAYLAMRVQESTRNVRVQLKKAHDDLMNPSEYGSDGETLLSYTLGSGHYLPSNAQIIKDFTEHDVENKITRNIFHKTLNTALKAQKVYITCTPDLLKRKKPHHKSGSTASSCKQDNTGPSNLKACITTTAEQSRSRGLGNEPVELACYMYKWATRGDATRHYNERPAGSDTWEDDWGVKPQDVITSSVKSHLNEMDDTSLMVNMHGRSSPETLADPSATGIFTIPVCISRHNWNNGVREFGYFDKLNHSTSKKNLPCSCGFWGDETKQVWEDMGIWDMHKSYYRTLLCPNQRRNHMDDRLEIYVNDCRLESRKGAFKTKLGKDGLCDIVMNILEELRKRGFEEELPHEIRDAIYCRVHKSGEACKNVKTDKPFSDILESLENEPYVWEPLVPEASKKATEALEIAEGLYSMSLRLALTSEHEKSVEKSGPGGHE